MKPIFSLCFTIICCLTTIVCQKTEAQCSTGYIRDTVNWDHLDFFPLTSSYTSFITTAQSQTQRFAFGVNRVTLTHNYTGTNAAGENATHTGQTGSFGLGENVEFLGDGSFGMNFSDTVRDLKFSLYDIDKNQRVTITAFVGSTPAPITLSVVAGSIITINTNNASPAVATAANSVEDDVTSMLATLNVQIPGSVTSVTVVITNTGTVTTGNASNRESGVFWLSDISACNRGTFPLNYYNVSMPFTGQPSYVIAARNDSVYYVDVATGRARFIFRHTLHNRINSLAYDPYRHFIYYTHSLSGSGGAINPNERTLRRYDYDMDTLGVVVSDVRTLGMPTFDNGVESGGAAFYNGRLYLGVESGSSASNESIIWRLNFDTSYAPVGPAVQVFGINGDQHDWADFGISNGILYDFDGKASNTDFYHLNLATGSVARFSPNPSTLIPRQVGVDWTGALYNIGSSSSISAATIVPYSNGSVNTAQEYPITLNGTAPVGSWGDAAEAFKPKTDFGDAPASYDPPTGDPATHERDDRIRLGTLIGIEWAKKTSLDASGDGPEEDGLTGMQVISRGVSSYIINVSVYNNTGANATLGGWIDANGDGIFQASEGVTMTVSSAASQQSVTLNWPSINVTAPLYSTTFLRLRLTSAINNLTAAKPTGFMLDGEVEDYPVTVSLVLPNQILSFDVQKRGENEASINWQVAQEKTVEKYQLQKSADGIHWTVLTELPAGNSGIAAGYQHADITPLKPITYYRIRQVDVSGAEKFSESKNVQFKRENIIAILPNPVSDFAQLSIQVAKTGRAKITIIDNARRVMFEKEINVQAGANRIDMSEISRLSSGLYTVRVQLANEVLNTLMILTK